MKSCLSFLEPLEARIAPAFAGVLELANLNGLDGFKLSGVTDGDRSGGSVSDAGDVNGDGFGDFIIGARHAGSLGYGNGASYVIFGKQGGSPPTVNLAFLDGSNGFRIDGFRPYDASGSAVSGAGDVNGDGFDDLIISAPFADLNGNDSGASYVLFGKANGFAVALNLSTLDGSNGFRIGGSSAYERSGSAVSAAGDVNGDGFGDLIIGASQARSNGSFSGASYVIFGKADGFEAGLNLSDLNGSNGFRVSGAAQNDSSGTSVGSAGDVNGDGFDDVIIGAPRVSPNALNVGASYVIFGKAGGFAADLNLATLNGTNGFKLTGIAENDYTGRSVSGAGDVNGDGLDDIIVGAAGAGSGSFTTGASYVVFGKKTAFASNLNLSALNGSNGFRIDGSFSDYAGGSVSGAGDVNGDGFEDLIIGAITASPNGDRSGASYVIFGKDTPFTSSLSVSTLDGANGFRLNGAAAQDFAGSSVSAAGDVNGDGFGDLIIGAPDASGNGRYSGVSYLVFGRGVSVSVSDAVVSEGNAGATVFPFTVSLSEPATFPITVRVATADGSARAGSDYTPLAPTTLTFAPGETSTAIFVNSTSDTTFEGDEIFSLVLSDAAGGVIRKGIGTATILNDDAAPVVAIANASIVEGDVGTSGLAFTVSLSAASGLPVAVGFAAVEGTARVGSDYAALAPGTLVFAPGETSKTINVDVLGDLEIENHEDFSVTLFEANGATLGHRTGVGTILNDDAVLRIGAPANLLEGDSGPRDFLFTVSLDQPSALPVTVNYASADGTATAGIDYTALAPGILTFAPGETSKQIAVEVLGDTTDEAAETFVVALTGATNALIAEPSVTANILNDDAPPIMTINGGTLVEGDGGTSVMTFEVNLSAASGLPVTVAYASEDGTASAGSDYTALTPGILTFAPGETSKQLAIEVLGDAIHEVDETFRVLLSGATNAVVAVPSATAIIRNDDAPPIITVSDGAVLEGDGGTSNLVFEVSLSAGSGLPATVRYATFDGTAFAGIDFSAPDADAQITFAPGETNRTITIPVNGDLSIEAHETFSLLLSRPTNAIISGGTATGTILNDDTAVTIADATLLESHNGTHPMSFEVSLAAPSALPVTVNFESMDGSTTSGLDYVALAPGTLTFAPGETSTVVTVDVIGDTLVEPSEIFTVALSSAVNAGIDGGTAIGTILDDDVTLVSKRKATFTDVDGDLVTIKVSKWTLKTENFTLFPAGLGSQLALVDFSGESEFAGANLSISAERPAGTSGGAALVNVGHIDASGVDLGKVVVCGDLGRIEVGDGLTPERGLVKLSAVSLGEQGLATQLPGGSMQSEFIGAVKALKLAGGMRDAVVLGSSDIGTVAIKGHFLGSEIRSDGNIGRIKIDGDFAASATNAAMISALGSLASPSSTEMIAIGKVSIGGSVEHAQILAGYDRTGAAINSDAGIGRVRVGRNWIASDLAAGATAGTDGFFGTEDDALLASDTSIVARIASILIKGTATGAANGADHFGFVAEEIGAFKLAGAKLTFDPGPSNDLAAVLVGSSGHLTAREVVSA